MSYFKVQPVVTQIGHKDSRQDKVTQFQTTIESKNQIEHRT